MKTTCRHKACGRWDRGMFELGHDARLICEEGNVAVIASVNDEGRSEDGSHGVLANVAKTIVHEGDVRRGGSIAMMCDGYGGRVTWNGT
jgi:hypothetical protein